jgi:hypothetical protein
MGALDRDAIINSINKTNTLAIYNPFLSDKNIDSQKEEDYDFEAALTMQGYYSKKELLKNALTVQEEKNKQKLISQEAQIQQSTQLRPVQEILEYIISPTDKKYNFISQDNILIEGKVDE